MILPHLLNSNALASTTTVNHATMVTTLLLICFYSGNSYPCYTTFFCITYSPADETYEVPELPLQSSRQGNDTEEDEEEDHTYEPLPFDTPRQ